ncbi:MAG TPA: hypothetical protein VEB63_00990 [Chitinophagaceae bacterium]|nr:hypothetical protein [Chitinophagaceae bacterium]
MKRSLLLLVSFLFSVQIFAQLSIRIGVHEPVRNSAGWTVPTSSFASVEEGRQIIQDILDAVGLRANFEIRTANIQNAAAVVYGGRRYILYNPNFINSLVRTSGNRWSAISVLAHEIGHHLNGHTLTGQGSQPAIELEADEFSGFALRKMGATLADAQAAMKLIANQQATATHPGRTSRLAAIEKGWDHADEQMTGVRRPQPTKEVVTPPTTGSTGQTGNTGQAGSRTVAETILDILGQIVFRQDPQGRYVITQGYNVAKLMNNRLVQVGKIARLNNSRYPYMIYDQRNNRLYVDRSGNIVNRYGQSVGVLRSA